MAKLAVREEFDLDDVNDSRKSRNVDCVSTVDDKGLGPTVPSEIEISDIVNGMMFLCFVQFTLLSCNVIRIITVVS